MNKTNKLKMASIARALDAVCKNLHSMRIDAAGLGLGWDKRSRTKLPVGMTKAEQATLDYHMTTLRVVWQELEEMADEVLAHIMKKTTQRSPEWSGGTNCMVMV